MNQTYIVAYIIAFLLVIALYISLGIIYELYKICNFKKMIKNEK